MSLEHFKDKYLVVDKETGEVLEIDMFIDKVPKEYWEKAYAKSLGDYVGAAGNASAEILAWILQNKSSDNVVLGSFAEIAKQCSTTKSTVSLLFQKLYGKNLMKKIRAGHYMLSPKVMRYGGNTKGAMVLRLWEDS